MPTSRTRNNNVVEQNKDLLAQTYHIDGRVTAIEGRMNTFGEQLNRIESALLNKQSPVSVGNVLTVMMMVGALLYGMASWTDLQNKNLKSNVDRNTQVTDQLQDSINDLDVFRSEMHFEVGTMQQRYESIKRWMERNDSYHDKLDTRIRGLEKQEAAAIVSRKAIGDYTKELGEIVHKNHGG